jgi:hypothetical protein
MTHAAKCSVIGGGILGLVLVAFGFHKVHQLIHRDAAKMEEVAVPIRMIAPESFVEFKLPNGWTETARFVDPENGNTIYIRNGRMIVVPKNGTKALVDTDPDE